MRILVVNQYFPPDATAAAHVLGELASDLAREHQVEVIAGRPSYSPDAGTAAPPGVSVRRVNSTAFARTSLLGRLLNYLSFVLLATAAVCRAERPDVIVVMTDPPMVGLVGALAARRHSRPFVQLCHDVYPDVATAVGVLKSPALVRLWRTLNSQVRARAGRIVVVGRDMQEKLTGDGCDPRKLAFVPVWADAEPLAEADVEEVRAQQGWQGRFVVMHAGNVGLAQGLERLVPAFEHLERELPDALVVVLGEGAGRRALEHEVTSRGLSNVQLMSHRSHQEAAALMGAADLHLVSLVPGLWGCAAPSKTYTVMALGRPFLAAVDAGSEPARIADEFGCGRWVPAGESEALARTVIEMAALPLEEMGARARLGFEQRYRRASSTSAIAKVLEEVARAN